MFRIASVLPQSPSGVLRHDAASSMWHTVAPYLHPVAGLGAIALAGYTASLGLRSRRARADAAAARGRHAAIGPWLYALFLVNWTGGVAAVRWLRPEVASAASGHFTVGSLIIALLSAATLLSRRMRTDPRARGMHPLLGAAALLLCGVQVFLGLQLLP